jgi:hypothetical protein
MRAVPKFLEVGIELDCMLRYHVKFVAQPIQLADHPFELLKVRPMLDP